LYISRKSSTVVQVADSLSITDAKIGIDVVLQIAKPVSKSVLQLNCLSVQQQVGIQDCGLFSIAFEVCNGNNIEKTEFNQSLNRIQSEFIKKAPS